MNESKRNKILATSVFLQIDGDNEVGALIRRYKALRNRNVWAFGAWALLSAAGSAFLSIFCLDDLLTAAIVGCLLFALLVSLWAMYYFAASGDLKYEFCRRVIHVSQNDQIRMICENYLDRHGHTLCYFYSNSWSM